VQYGRQGKVVRLGHTWVGCIRGVIVLRPQLPSDYLLVASRFVEIVVALGRGA